MDPLRVRWLGTVPYADAHALQTGLHAGDQDHLLLLEHPHTYTLGVRADPQHVLVDPASVGAALVETDRGGDVTYHGPGQLVGYPVLRVPGKRGGGMADTVAYVRAVEQVVIDAVTALGLTDVGRLADYPGVWVAPGSDAPRKLAAIGVRLTRGRSMHGFALNVAPDLAYFSYIVPCGIPDKAVTSLAAEGLDVAMADVVDAVVAAAAVHLPPGGSLPRIVERTAVIDGVALDGATPVHLTTNARRRSGETTPRRAARLDAAGVHGGLGARERKPDWLRAPLRTTAGFGATRRTVEALRLTTVCEEAGCPNISECWDDGTATFMINGERCTRACGFCLVDTRKPGPLDPTEAARVAEAVDQLGLAFAVITAVARDDLADGGADAFARTIDAVRARCPDTRVEVLIPDCKGDADALDVIFAARPDVVNHNLETVARLQRAVRPSADYARSLAVLARARAAGLVTKSGLMVGLGETSDEVVSAMADLRAVGVDIVTIGQYLRPTAAHLPVARWWTPDELTELKRIGEDSLGLPHVEASPLTRSSYHARQAAAGAVPV
ncbi:MAG: lipoyl synthase [Acidimicrobiales bacterium]|nr:lipoyl synthase [Acidimicrobiales bacterium]